MGDAKMAKLIDRCDVGLRELERMDRETKAYLASGYATPEIQQRARSLVSRLRQAREETRGVLEILARKPGAAP